VEAGLKGSIEQHYSSFSTTPIASASVAQVHEATTVEGRRVAVKVLRPGVRKLIDTDMSILSFLARQLEANFDEVRFLDLQGVLREFGRSLRAETNLVSERKNIQRFAAQFADRKDLVIPGVYPEHCGQTVLTMDFIDGVPARQSMDKGYDMERISRAFLDTAYSMLLEHGFFHADMHPGNVFVLEGGRLALLDFGMVGQLTPAMRDSLATLILAVWRNDVRTLARAFYELAIHREPVNYVAYERDVQRLLEEGIGTGDRSLSSIQFGALFGAVMEGAMVHRMTMPPDYMMFFKCIISAEGLARQLAPNVDPVAEAAPYVERLVKERYSPERLREDALMFGLELQTVARQFPVVLSQLTRDYLEGRLKVPVEMERSPGARSERRDEQRRLRAALVLIGLVGAMAWSMPDVDTAYVVTGIWTGLRLWGAPLLFGGLALLVGYTALGSLGD